MTVSFNVSMQVKEGGKSTPIDFASDTDGKITLQDMLRTVKASLLRIAYSALREEQATGFPKDPFVVVDNKFYKPIEDVKPFGKIQFIRKAPASEFLLSVYDAILSRSLVDSGLYKDSNIVMVDNVIVAKNRPQLESWIKSGPAIKSTSYVYFINVTPYAGKLERQARSSRAKGVRRGKLRVVKSSDEKLRSGTHVNAANGAYYLASRQIIKAYRNMARIYFNWTPGSTIGFQNLPSVSRSGRPLRKTFSPSNRRHKGNYVYPTIRIKFSTGGVV